MEQLDAAKALTALGHETRLAVFRYLVPQGPDGLPAGKIGEALGVPPNALSFHLNRLVNASLIRVRRQGRHMLYAAHYENVRDLLDFLTEDCCGTVPEGCLPVCPAPRTQSRSQRSACGGSAKSARRRAAKQTGGRS